jgi:hypothetical protein
MRHVIPSAAWVAAAASALAVAASTPAAADLVPGGGGATTTGKSKNGVQASEALLSSSLRSAVRKGLLVGYTVSEQVAGHFQVSIDASTARRLGLGSHPMVIGKAILVTTMGGHGSLRIRFGKRVRAKLRRARSVTATLSLTVTGPDLITTVIAQTITLHR